MSNKQTEVDTTNGRRRELTRALYEDKQANGAVILTTEQRTAYERELAWYKKNPTASEADWRAYEYERAQLNSEAKRERLAKEANEKRWLRRRRRKLKKNCAPSLKKRRTNIFSGSARKRSGHSDS